MEAIKFGGASQGLVVVYLERHVVGVGVRMSLRSVGYNNVTSVIVGRVARELFGPRANQEGEFCCHFSGRQTIRKRRVLTLGDRRLLTIGDR